MSDDLKKVLAGLGNGTSLGGQTEPGPIGGAEMRSLGADESVADHQRIQEGGWLLRFVVT